MVTYLLESESEGRWEQNQKEQYVKHVDLRSCPWRLVKTRGKSKTYINIGRV